MGSSYLSSPMEVLEPYIDDFSAVVADFTKEEMKETQDGLDISDSWANLSTLFSQERKMGELEEETGSRNVSVILASKVLGRPLVIDGHKEYETPFLKQMLRNQKVFMSSGFPKLEETGEMTVSSTVEGNLPKRSGRSCAYCCG